MRMVPSLVLLGVCLLAAGCQNALVEERDKLYAENRQLREQNEALKMRPPAGDDARVRDLQAQLAARDAELARLREQPPTGAVPGMEGLDTVYDPKAGTLTVNIAGDVLFDSGKKELKSTALATLDKVVAALKNQYAGRPVRVEGHTDSDPINKTRDTYADNLELSMERAAMVSRYLIKQGVDAKRITTSGLGEHHPKGSKPASRRVEIVVVMK